MKIKTLFILGLLSASASAAVTIGGATVTLAKKADGATAIPAGTLGMLIVDTAGDGFFSTLINSTGNTALTTTSQLNTKDPLLTSSLANLSVAAGAAGLFGGEKILATFASVGTTGTFSNIMTGVSIAGYESKNFAIVWFSDILKASAPATAASGATWGIIRGSDWILPSSDSGTFTSSATDAAGATSYYAPSALAGGASTTAFRTTTDGATATLGGAGFSIVPEPSAALLGALGALGLLRRRRI